MKVVLSKNRIPVNQPSIYFNNSTVSVMPSQKHLDLILDGISKANKGIGLLKQVSHILPRKSSLAIYKAFILPHLDYADVIYDQLHNETFCNMIESVQYNVALAITETIRVSSRDRVYQELVLESLRDGR